jgi:hypothetical protein
LTFIYLSEIIVVWTFAKNVTERDARFAMPVIDMTGLDTQIAPMKAIDEILTDYYEGSINSREAIEIINAINYEWKH